VWENNAQAQFKSILKWEKKTIRAAMPIRRRHGRAGGAWLMLAGMCAGVASANVMRGFGSGSSSPSDADILVKLQALYAEKLKPLEKKSRQAAILPAAFVGSLASSRLIERCSDLSHHLECRPLGAFPSS
jgi:hypothetical protein